MITFSKWSGPEGIETFIINQTGCKPYSGAGINPRIEKKDYNTKISRQYLLLQ